MTKKVDEIIVKNPKSLKVYEKAMELNKLVYQLVKQFPWIENKNLTIQLLKCATSIGANLCEGNGQIYSAKELTFLNNSLGSAQECRYWLELALINKYITQEQYQKTDNLTQEIIRMLIAMMKKIKEEVA